MIYFVKFSRKLDLGISYHDFTFSTILEEWVGHQVWTCLLMVNFLINWGYFHHLNLLPYLHLIPRGCVASFIMRGIHACFLIVIRHWRWRGRQKHLPSKLFPFHLLQLQLQGKNLSLLHLPPQFLYLKSLIFNLHMFWIYLQCFRFILDSMNFEF